MYKAAITLFESQVRIEQKNNILKAVKEIGVDVNKEELLKALKYDREQYVSGLIQHILAEIKERF